MPKISKNASGLDVDWVGVDEAYASINKDKKNGFNVKMPVGVEAYIDGGEDK